MNKLLLICSLDEEKSSSIKSTQKKQSNLEETSRYPHGKQETNTLIYSLILLLKQEETKE
jgi:hypothetical protein